MVIKMKKTAENNAADGQGESIRISVETCGGILGIHAVESLSEVIAEMKKKKTSHEIMAHYYTIYGYVSCCVQCGFMTQGSADKLMDTVKKMTDEVLGRMQGRNLLQREE